MSLQSTFVGSQPSFQAALPSSNNTLNFPVMCFGPTPSSGGEQLIDRSNFILSGLATYLMIVGK